MFLQRTVARIAISRLTTGLIGAPQLVLGTQTVRDHRLQCGPFVRPRASHVNHSRSTSAIRNAGTSVRADCRTTKWKKTSDGNEGIEMWTDAPPLSQNQSSTPDRATQWPSHLPISQIRR